MKPAWDKLMKKFANSETVVVGDVDCTAAGKELCGTVGVQGYPTIKYGDPSGLEKYEGGRTFKDLVKFAGTLKPSCSPSNIDLCDEAQRKEIEDIQSLPDEELAASIKEGEDAIKTAEKFFETELEKLQATFKKLQEDKENTIAEVKASGLSLKKSVHAAKLKAASAPKKEKDEL